MTKHPLVFLTGIRSLFFYEKLGADLQDFIAAHGYIVKCPALPFRSPQLRRKALSDWISQQKEKSFHFVLSAATQREFADIFKSCSNCTFTLTRSVKGSKEPLTYKAHRYFCSLLGTNADPFNDTLPDKSNAFYDRFLDRCVELAENETL